MIRRATRDDSRSVLSMFDEAIAWFISIGNTGQWGSEPFSSSPRRVDQVTAWCSGPGSWVAVDAQDAALAALVLGDAHDYVPRAEVPELYVKVLVASRAPGARGAGRRLMAFADGEAARAGVERLRVDCYAGGSGRLVEFYESCGYRRMQPFTVRDWPGQLLVKAVPGEMASSPTD